MRGAFLSSTPLLVLGLAVFVVALNIRCAAGRFCALAQSVAVLEPGRILYKMLDSGGAMIAVCAVGPLATA